jgi:hypothetical protein
MFEVEPEILIEEVQKHYDLTEITIPDNFIQEFNLDINVFNSIGIFGRTKLKEKTKSEYSVDKKAYLLDKAKMNNYALTLLDISKDIVSMDRNNFYISERGIASRDFRVLINSPTTPIPEKVLLNAASVAVLMLAGLIEIPVGNDHIQSIMRQYGSAQFEFAMKGYLHISIGDGKVTSKYVADTKFIPKL